MILFTYFYTYILRSKSDNGLYIGYSADLKRRFQEHKKGKCTSTRSRGPLELIYYESFINKKDAKAREKFLKSGYGREQMKSFLKSTLGE